MAEITAGLVKQLRDKTGAGMMDCKKALTETEGAMEDAVIWLRKKGLAAAAKKSGRVAAEGLVAMRVEGNSGALVEVNAETDFVARNESFQGFAAEAAAIALKTGGDIDTLKAAEYPGKGHSVEDELTALIARIGENMVLRRSARLSVGKGLVCGYMHNQAAPDLGKIGVLVAIESDIPAESLAEIGKQLAMHVAAAAPQALRVKDVDATALDNERAILADQARASGKPEEIIEKMVEGRLRKYYEEVVLLEQLWVLDGKTKVSKAVEDAAKAAGGTATVTGYCRFALGEGIEREESDFAAEVAAQLGN
jgi:elongation factor Ts